MYRPAVFLGVRNSRFWEGGKLYVGSFPFMVVLFLLSIIQEATYHPKKYADFPRWTNTTTALVFTDKLIEIQKNYSWCMCTYKSTILSKI